MQFYRITFKSIPHILFACSAEYTNYQNHFRPKKGYLEICLIEEGTIVYRYDAHTERLVPPGTLAVITQGIPPLDAYAYSNQFQRHTCVGIHADYELESFDTSAPSELLALHESLRDEGCFLIPAYENMDTHASDILVALQKISAAFLSPRPEQHAMALSRFFALTARLTELVLQNPETAPGISPAAIRYVRRAGDYIAAHITEPLTVAQIAAHLGLSCGYLQSIFKKVYGISPVEFTNRYRIQLAVSYLASQNLTLSELSQKVGISDPAYMSRLFKKITGQSFRQYRAKLQTPADAELLPFRYHPY